MKKKIFYSWQSDLPYETNKTFIQECIKTAIDEMNRDSEFVIDEREEKYSFDKDTMGEGGTPHIADTIFTKISKSSFFIADISIINSNAEGRKTPNPNVLLELGYAAKSLGWDRIICVFNEDYGSFDDLPFDLRFRRPLTYSLSGKEEKKVKKLKKEMVNILKSNISNANAITVSAHAENEYLIVEADTLESFVQKRIVEFFGMNTSKRKFNFLGDNYTIEMWDNIDYLVENELPCEDTDIEIGIKIVFGDDMYSYNEYKNQRCSVIFTFQECFKQINFNEHKVYSAFRTSRGYSPSGLNRDYDQLSKDILRHLLKKNDE